MADAVLWTLCRCVHNTADLTQALAVVLPKVSRRAVFTLPDFFEVLTLSDDMLACGARSFSAGLF
eukprot:3337602-Pleurochrysis_carterae.AAC.3